MKRFALFLGSALAALALFAAVTGYAQAAHAGAERVSGAAPAAAAQAITGTAVLMEGPAEFDSGGGAQPPAVRFHVSVLNDQGGAATGLGRSELTVTEDGKPVQNLKIAEEQAGIAVVLVLDRGSMSQPGVNNKRRWDDAAQLAISLTGQLQPGSDYVGLVALDAGGKLGPTTTLGTDAGAVVSATLQGAAVAGATALYDGVCSALDMLAAPGQPELQAQLSIRRRVVVIFSAALDTSSTACSATDVRDRARAQEVSLYTVGIQTPADKRGKNDVPLDPAQLNWLAAQTGGLYYGHADAAGHDALLAFFGQLVTQRRQYLITYETRALKGAHEVVIQAALPSGTAAQSTTFTSTLALPSVALAEPDAGAVITQAYVPTMTAPVTMDVALKYPDGLQRAPARVEYVINGVLVATREQQPFSAAWDVTRVATGTYGITAFVYDSLLESAAPVSSTEVLVDVVREPPRAPAQTDLILAWLQRNMLTIVCVPGTGLLLGLGLIMYRQVMATARRTSARLSENMPRVFGAARARLVVTRGANVGKEFRLNKSLCVVGREQSLCDIALDDRYVSARHATIRLDADGTFAIVDEGSQNGTLVNGTRIPPRQPIPLPLDSTLRLGETELVLRGVSTAGPAA